jgi:hypothetical protein
MKLSAINNFHCPASPVSQLEILLRTLLVTIIIPKIIRIIKGVIFAIFLLCIQDIQGSISIWRLATLTRLSRVLIPLGHTFPNSWSTDHLCKKFHVVCLHFQGDINYDKGGTLPSFQSTSHRVLSWGSCSAIMLKACKFVLLLFMHK